MLETSLIVKSHQEYMTFFWHVEAKDIATYLISHRKLSQNKGLLGSNYLLC